MLCLKDAQREVKREREKTILPANIYLSFSLLYDVYSRFDVLFFPSHNDTSMRGRQRQSEKEEKRLFRTILFSLRSRRSNSIDEKIRRGKNKCIIMLKRY